MKDLISFLQAETLETQVLSKQGALAAYLLHQNQLGQESLFRNTCYLKILRIHRKAEDRILCTITYLPNACFQTYDFKGEGKKKTKYSLKALSYK